MTDVLQQAKALIWQHNESGFIHRDATMLLPELVAECERWRAAASKSADMGMELCKDNKWLLSERARLEKIAIEEHASSMYYHFTDTPRSSFSEESEKVKSRYREQAAHELGIATSDHIREPTKMMLTQEQRAALDNAIEIYEVAIKKNFESDPVGTILESAGLRHDIDVFKAMLDQSRPAWEITEERQAAIELAQYGFRGFPQDTIDASIEVLQDMLEECQK